MNYLEFNGFATQAGLTTRECHATHWQVSGGGVTFNVWPMAGGLLKFLRKGEKPGVKARVDRYQNVLLLVQRAAAANGIDASRPQPQPERWRLTVQQNEGGSFTIISHGDAIEEVTFDEMLGIVCNVFHTPKQKQRAETLFASEKRFRRRREQAAPADFAVVE